MPQMHPHQFAGRPSMLSVRLLIPAQSEQQPDSDAEEKLLVVLTVHSAQSQHFIRVPRL